MTNDDPGLSHRLRRVLPPTARTAAAIVATVGLALLVSACGGSPGSRVAELGPANTQPASSSGGPNVGGSTNSQSPSAQPLAFSHCMRANGVPNFPDPNSSGVWPKSRVDLAACNPRFEAATQACGYLLPDGGPGVLPSPAVVQQIRTDMTKFARCMRSHGVRNWPDPTLDRGRAIFDPQTAGIDTNSRKITAKMRECEHVFPASLGIPPGA
jgi:hypothetical protein